MHRRVFANGDGSESVLTFFRLPNASKDAFARDAAAAERDLLTLKGPLEGDPSGTQRLSQGVESGDGEFSTVAASRAA